MDPIIVDSEPVELVIAGTSILMQADPSGGKAWQTLLEIEVTYINPDERALMVSALAALANTPDDAALIEKLEVGTATLKRAAEGYVRAVTGFPTEPSSRSKKN